MEIYADLGTLGIFNYRIPPHHLGNLCRSWHFGYFQLQNTPPPMEIYADLGTLGIFNFRIHGNLCRSWHFGYFQLQNTPPHADLGTLGIFNYRIPPLPPFREAHTHTHTYTMPSHTHILCHLVCIVGEIILHCG